MPAETWEQNIESRISRLESEVSKSNLSEGLALSFEKIMENIETIVNKIDNDPDDRLVVPIAGVAAHLIKKAFEIEAHRLRKKG